MRPQPAALAPQAETASASLILGAGWSYAAGLPLTKDLFRVYPMEVSAEAKRRLRRVADAFRNWQRRHPDGNGEQFLEYVHSNQPVPWQWAVEYVGAVLSTPIPGDTHASQNVRYAVRLTKRTYCAAHDTFVEQVLSSYRLLGVVTTNYDILAERALRHRPTGRPARPGFYYGGLPRPQFARGLAEPFTVHRRNTEVELVGEVPLFKLHGSLNWARGNDGSIEIFQDLRLAFRHGGSAAIVPPITEKDCPPWLKNIWRAATACLKASEVWIVVGFSLPAYDQAIFDMFRESGESVSKVVIVDPSAASIKERWATVAPNAKVETRTEGLPRRVPALTPPPPSSGRPPDENGQLQLPGVL